MSSTFKGLSAIKEMADTINATGEFPQMVISTVSAEPSSYREGQFPILRQHWEQELIRLFDAYKPERDNSWREFAEEFENDTFWVHPDYQHIECSCGVFEASKQWLTDNPHLPACLQHEIAAIVAEIVERHPLPDFSPLRRMSSVDIRRSVAFMNGRRLELTEDEAAAEKLENDTFDQTRQAYVSASEARDAEVRAASWQFIQRYNLKGDSVGYSEDNAVWIWEYICTCDREKRHREWVAGQPDCARPCEMWWANQPNFFYKPTGYGVHWYKYPCRESYGTALLQPEAFSSIVDDCIRSLQPTN